MLEGRAPASAHPTRSGAHRRVVAGLAALALVVTACGADESASVAPASSAPPEASVEPASPQAASPDSSPSGEVAGETSDVVPARFSNVPRWEPDAASRITLEEDQVAPVIQADQVRDFMPGRLVWDWWPVRARDGSVAQLGGWHVMIALTTPDDVVPGKRHDQAVHYYAISRDGTTWQEGGPVYPEGEALGTRQWAGSAMVDGDQITTFYTAAGRGQGEGGADTGSPSPDASAAANSASPETGGSGLSSPQPAPGGISYEQRMVAAQATVVADDNGVRFEDWGEHRVILEGDGELYAQTANTQGGAGRIDAFRDPWYFQDPADGQDYLLFTATLPEAACDGDGVVGVARSTGDLMSWEAQDPILMAPCVNNELERPHLVLQDDQYYLFFTTHSHTFDPQLTGGETPTVSPMPDASGSPDASATAAEGEAATPAIGQPDTARFPEGLYGFVGDGLRADYRPLNQSGLVLANPEDEPYQAYSWIMLPNRWVQSFTQYVNLGGMTIQEIGQQDEQFQKDRFVGQPAPAVRVELNGDQTSIVDETYDYAPVFGD